MRFLTEYPLSAEATGDFNRPERMAEFLRVAEAAGLDGVGFIDHPAQPKKWLERGGHETLDPFVALAYCAGVTTTMRLFTHMAVAPYRNPFLLAKEITTLDVVSAGRATIGLGSGYLRQEFAALGVPFDERGDLFDETLEVLEGMFAAPDGFSFEGRHFRAAGQVLRPGPVQLPHPPIWFGGNTDRVLDRVARHGHGWAPMTFGAPLAKTLRTRLIESNAHLGALIGQLGDRLEANGRERRDVDVFAMSVGSYATGDDDMAKQLDTIAELAELGVTWTACPHPRDDFDAALDYIRRFGEEVVARVR